MAIIEHKINDNLVAEIVSQNPIISTVQQGADLVGELFFQGYSTAIFRKENFSIDFFDLKTGVLGEVLQKFTTYRIRLFIVGDFSKITSESLKAFIFESNKGSQINFVETQQEAINILKRK